MQLQCRISDTMIRYSTVERTVGQCPWLLYSIAMQVRINPHPFAVITSSPSVVDGYAYIGYSSTEEQLGNPVQAQMLGFPGYVCCSFRGSLSKVDVRTGRVEWTFFTQPALPAGTNATQWYAGEPWANPSCNICNSLIAAAAASLTVLVLISTRLG